MVLMRQSHAETFDPEAVAGPAAVTRWSTDGGLILPFGSFASLVLSKGITVVYLWRRYNTAGTITFRLFNARIILFSWVLWLLPAYTGRNYCFCHQARVPRFKKSSFSQFQRFVKTLLGHTVPFNEKRGQWKVFFGYWLPYMLLLWLGESVLSDDIHPN